MDERVYPLFKLVGKISAGIAISIVLYVLSIGPAALLLFATSPGAWAEKLLTAAYAPVLWLRDNTTMQKPLDAYIAFWLNF